MTQAPDPATPSRNETAWVAAILTAIVFGVYWPLFDLALLGWDTWPMILTARVESWSGFIGCISESLMDGRYPHGEYYRPITNLTFALNYAIGGLESTAYHVTDLAILLANTLLIARLAQLFCRGISSQVQRGLMALLAGALFALHPLQLELLPAPPRRADTLALFFTLTCLLLQYRKSQAPGQSVARRVASGLVAFLAIGSKETGAIVLPIVLSWHLCLAGTQGTWGPRIRLAWTQSLPVFIGVCLFFVLRWIILGGIGGPSSLGPEPMDTAALVTSLASRSLLPWGLSGSPFGLLPDLSIGLWAGGLSICLAAGLFLASQQSARNPIPASPWDEPTLAFFALWIAAGFALTLMAEQMRDWYALLLLAPICLLVAGGCLSLNQRRPLAGRILLLVCPALAGTWVIQSWPLQPTPRLDAISELSRQDLRRLEEVVSRHREGEAVHLNPWHPMLEPAAHGHGVRSLFATFDYSLQAWCELRWPERTIEVRKLSPQRMQPEPGILSIQLIPGPEPPWID